MSYYRFMIQVNKDVVHANFAVRIQSIKAAIAKLNPDNQAELLAIIESDEWKMISDLDKHAPQMRKALAKLYAKINQAPAAASKESKACRKAIYQTLVDLAAYCPLNEIHKPNGKLICPVSGDLIENEPWTVILSNGYICTKASLEKYKSQKHMQRKIPSTAEVDLTLEDVKVIHERKRNRTDRTLAGILFGGIFAVLAMEAAVFGLEFAGVFIGDLLLKALVTVGINPIAATIFIAALIIVVPIALGIGIGLLIAKLINKYGDTFEFDLEKIPDEVCEETCVVKENCDLSSTASLQKGLDVKAEPVVNNNEEQDDVIIEEQELEPEPPVSVSALAPEVAAAGMGAKY